MKSNISVLTVAAQTAIDQDVRDYQNAVAAHVGGDWGGHNQFRLYTTPFAEAVSGHTIANGYLMRVQLSGTNGDGSGEGAFTMPVILSGSNVDVGMAPVIVSQPSSITVLAGSTATFNVTTASATPVAYQWRKNAVNIAGAVSASYVIPSAQLTDAGSYSVAATNDHGSVTSVNAILTVN